MNILVLQSTFTSIINFQSHSLVNQIITSKTEWLVVSKYLFYMS